MKHLYSLKVMPAWIIMLFVAMVAIPIQAKAQATIGFQEDFDYPLGNLYGQGDWVHDNAKYTANPIQVVEKVLSYEGYSDGANGKCVKLGKEKVSEKLQKRFDNSEKGTLAGNVYYSALINIEEQPTDKCYPIALTARSGSYEVSEGRNGLELGRLFINKGDNAGEVKVGIERGGTSAVYSATPLKLNQTYLVVVRFEVQPVCHDNVYLYVNPTDFKKEPLKADAVIDGINFSGSGLKVDKELGLQGFILRQSSTGTATAPNMYVGSVRVSATYAGLFGNGGVDTTPKLSVSKKTFMLGEAYTDNQYEETIIVKGENLTGDVTVEPSLAAVTVSPTTLAAADVMSDAGVELKIKVTFTEGEQNATIILKSEGAEDITLKLSWTGITIPKIATVKELYSKDPEGGEVYKYTGEAIISFVDRGGDSPVFYLQDESAAISLSDVWGILTKTDYNVGDKITGTILGVQSVAGTIGAFAAGADLGEVVSTGNIVAPVEATLTQLKEAPANYIQKLVKVKNLKFKDVTEGAKFAEGMMQPVVTDGAEEAKVRIFKGTSLIGKDIPTADVTLVGLFTSMKVLLIGPRGIEDITEQMPQGEPSITFTPEKIEQTAGVLGKTVEVATIHVSAKNMKVATFLELAGKNADQFSLSQSKIDKGSTETDIVISYTPTEVAVHKAYIMVNCPSIEYYDKTIHFSAYAIDEQNPPTIILNPQTLQKFEAKVNEASEQTIEVTTANMPDYAYVKVKDAGKFVLSNTMLIRNTKNTVKVTFKSTTAGTYATSLIFSALGMTDVELPIEGVATGDIPEEEKEGVDFVLSEENPLTQLNETFDNIVRNKPLVVDGWTNSAIKGTRAWWGFSFLDYDTESPNEKVAKVTPYDSKMEPNTGTPVEMILVTPPLDFKNATSKVFSFKVRGDYLQDNQTDKLELCYIDLADGEPYIQPMAECRMPCTKDESGKWFPYNVDLTGQQIADVFFIAFRFTSTRGIENAATYYIDDVTYGLGATTIQTVVMEEKTHVMIYDLAGNKVVEKVEATAAEATSGLARGIYIVKTISNNGIHTSKVQIK